MPSCHLCAFVCARHFLTWQDVQWALPLAKEHWLPVLGKDWLLAPQQADSAMSLGLMHDPVPL